ncbi:MAG: hypothetical protein ABI741_15770 [Ferruginibacter sp.]
MKTRNKILLASATIAVTGLLVYAASRHKKTKKMLSEIANEGYETAHDVMYPGKDKRNSKLKYGPVLPA